MADTIYTWAISNLERHTADGIVFTVHYTVSARDDSYSSSAYGSLGLEPPELDSMVPYSDLTPDLCVQWVKDKFGDDKVEAIEQQLQAQLDEQHAPTKASGVPWQ